MKLVLVLVVITVGCAALPESVAYNYASDQAWVHCADVCPGVDCPCILGESDTWYISPEIGE